MFNIVVADDDKIIRKGLIKIIENNTTEFKVIGEASNGARALEIIADLKPDILITDIKMPVMDGVELVNKISEMNLNINTIVLSGFDDYKYVRETLKGGAVDYILKPIDNKAMFELLNKIKEDIEHKKKEKIKINNFKELVTESEKVLREKFLMDILCKSSLTEEDISHFNELNMEASQRFLIAVVSFDMLYNYKNEVSNTVNRLVETFKEKVYSSIANNEYQVVVGDKNNEIVLLYESAVYNSIKSSLHEMQNFYAEDITFTVGIGKEFKNLADILTAYKQAISAVDYRFYRGNNKVYEYEEINNEAINEINNNELEILTNALINSIQICSTEKVRGINSKIFDYVLQFNIEPLKLRKIMSNLIIKLCANEQDFQEALDENVGGDVISYIENINTFSELQIYMMNLLIRVTGVMKNIRTERGKKSIERAKIYIQEHYSEDITLKMVAEHVFLNANYFSKLFKDEVDKNFIDYLIETRITAAKELLKTPGIKVYEVAQSIGYEEVVSFNRAFKKVVGVSPKEYINLSN